MFASFTRDLLRPEMSNTLDALLRQSPRKDPIDDYVPSCGGFHRRDRIDYGSEDKFQLFMNLKQFTKKEVQIKIVNGFIVVHAKHGEQIDTHGFVCREFIRRYKMPPYIEPSTIKCVFNRNKVLIIQALMKIPKPANADEKIIPVEDPKPYGVDALQSSSFEHVADVHRDALGN